MSRCGSRGPFRPRRAIRQRALPALAHKARHHVFDESPRALLGSKDCPPTEREDEGQAAVVLAPMESCFATVKKELVHHEEYPTRAAARQSLFEYIEVFYNRVRRHSALGDQSPAQFAEAA